MATVLFIEDEPALGMIVKDSLVYRGFEVLYAANGTDGLEQYRQHHPDIVVADIMMPDMDGFTMAEQIRRDDPHTPIMFLTARSQTSDVVRGFELGGNDYLKKPFSLDELVARINALLRTGASRTNANGTLKIGRYIFDPAKQKLTVDDHEVTLSHREANCSAASTSNATRSSAAAKFSPSFGATTRSSTVAASTSSSPNFAATSARTLRSRSLISGEEGISWCFEKRGFCIFVETR